MPRLVVSGYDWRRQYNFVVPLDVRSFPIMGTVLVSNPDFSTQA